MIQIAAVIQARMGSTRRPGKVTHFLAGVPMIDHILRRIQHVPEFDAVVLAVPDSPSEAPLAEAASRMGVRLVRGPEEDVLQRFILAGETVQARHIARICSDCPLVDLTLAQTLCRSHLESGADYTITPDSIPLGTGLELVRLDTLRQIARETASPIFREHVTNYIHAHPEQFRQNHVPAPAHLRGKTFRLTVDTDPDLVLMENIFKTFYTPLQPVLKLEDIIPYLDSHPELTQINTEVVQKDWRKEAK
ncbi:MAG: hypothetical protein COV67_02550 [Nitrospinae bacterium CG11_big_fil_rev_8_21_14_0_20_56_8]|nr:MAG: hypothetical protein COV67_02550 [Nitrospinae bacterium CG11_big_fil_rev_8_21_14_0_20_56_8]